MLYIIKHSLDLRLFQNLLPLECVEVQGTELKMCIEQTAINRQDIVKQVSI